MTQVGDEPTIVDGSHVGATLGTEIEKTTILKAINLINAWFTRQKASKEKT